MQAVSVETGTANILEKLSKNYDALNLRTMLWSSLNTIVIVVVAIWYGVTLIRHGGNIKDNKNGLDKLTTFDSHISQNEVDALVSSLLTNVAVSAEGMEVNETALKSNMRGHFMSLAYQTECYAGNDIQGIDMDPATGGVQESQLYHVVPDQCIEDYLILCGNNTAGTKYQSECTTIIADSKKIIDDDAEVKTTSVSGTVAACWAGLCASYGDGFDTNYADMCKTVEDYDTMPESVHGIKCSALHHEDNLKAIPSPPSPPSSPSPPPAA